jgi:hypothetical protein
MIAALLALSGVAGATGGMMSVIQRVQASTPENCGVLRTSDGNDLCFRPKPVLRGRDAKWLGISSLSI